MRPLCYNCLANSGIIKGDYMHDIQIIIHKDELRTDSRLLASFLDHRHRTILENVDKYRAELEQLGKVPVLNGILQTAGGPQSQRYVVLNEDQCYFLLTLMRNNDHVVRAKLALVKAFRDARTQLASRDIARIDGKQVRRLETDSIAELVRYAKASGSKNADRYFSIVTKMTNKIVGIEAGQRDDLNARQLNEIRILETIVANAISDGISSDMYYKDIYKLASMRCEAAGSAMLLTLK